MSECPQIERTHALADGELTGQAAEAARDHVADCRQCQAELADVMQLAALPVPRTTSEDAVGGVVSLAWYRRRAVQVAAAGIGLAAGVALYVAHSNRGDGLSSGAPRIALALEPNRSIEARVAWSGAADYRAYAVSRADEAPRETIPLAALASVEQRGDLHGVGALALLNGDRKQAAAYLSRAGESPAVLADRAALALANADPSAALDLADAALDRAPGQAAATWNRGLALRDLGLGHGAAAAFGQVAAMGEPGWADEAKQRAANLNAEFAEQLDLSLRVAAAAKTLATTFEGLALDDARALPGMARIALYDAIRAAPTRAALDKLRPLAEAIDAVDHTTTAVGALARQPDPKLAKGYAAILAGHPPPREAYLASLRAAKANDLLIGALLKFGDGYEVAAADLPEFARLTAASSDPWTQLLGIEQQARAALARGDLPAAEAFLLRAPAICAAGAPNYRCMTLALLAGQVYLEWQRLPDARVALEEAWRRARASGQWEQQSEVLFQFAQLAALADDVTGGGLPLVRAYAEEFVARHKLMAARGQLESACHAERWAAEHIAMVQVNRRKFADAAEKIAAAPQCATSPAPAILFIRAQVAQLTGSAGDIDGVARDIAAARAQPGLTASDRATLDHAEGRLLIDRDPPRAEALLRRSIGLAASSSGASGTQVAEPGRAVGSVPPSASRDANARRIAGASYALLAVLAARRDDAAGSLSLLAKEVGTIAPETCVLGLAADDTATIAVARGVDGTPIATHQVRDGNDPRARGSSAQDGSGESRPSGDRAGDSGARVFVEGAPQRDEPGKLAPGTRGSDPGSLVPDAVVAVLSKCPVVDVLARPPLHGLGRVLPASIAWRYLSVRTRPAGASAAGRVVVANVEPPPSLGLPRLGGWSGKASVAITGSAATPARVLAALANAGDIVIHAHGLVDQADASYLALSPDASGAYALTASAVGAARFTGHPLVILAACSAAKAAPVLHARWSLPDAFIAAGARAVIASAGPIPDAEAAAFFDALRENMRTGSPIAVALRDVRQRWISERAGDWTRDIIVFE